jgi:hypothetical protein
LGGFDGFHVRQGTQIRISFQGQPLPFPSQACAGMSSRACP